jgi:hypothetical protein
MKFKNSLFLLALFYLFNCEVVKCANAMKNPRNDSLRQLAEILKEIRAIEDAKKAKDIQAAFSILKTLVIVEAQKPLYKMNLITMDGQKCNCIVNTPLDIETLEHLIGYSMSKNHKCNKIQCDPKYCSKRDCKYHHGPNRYLDQNPQAKVESDSDSD